MLERTLWTVLAVVLGSTSVRGQTLSNKCYCPNSTEYQTPNVTIYNQLRQVARQNCRTQQYTNSMVIRIPDLTV